MTDGLVGSGDRSGRPARLQLFGGFGLTAPRNALSCTTIALGGLSIASAIFVILELDSPFSGFFTVSSQPMPHALTHLTQ
jgi:hypothetical protein